MRKTESHYLSNYEPYNVTKFESVQDHPIPKDFGYSVSILTYWISFRFKELQYVNNDTQGDGDK